MQWLALADRLVVMRDIRIPDAVQRLDAEKRALLELHFWRGVPDSEIAGLLGIEQHEVHRRRQEGMQDLCAELGLEDSEQRRELIERLHSMPDGAWRGDSAALEPPDEDGSAGRRRRPALLTALAVVILAAVIAAALSAGEDGGGQPDRATAPFGEPGDPARPSATAPKGPRVGLQAVTAGPGDGTARLVRRRSERRLLLRVRGLPSPRRGGYVVWLYNTVGVARSIGGSQRGSFRLDARLPKGASRYRAIDISLEAADGIRAHGGDSVLRVSLARLGGRR